MPSGPEEELRSELAALAAYLHARRKAILDAWSRAAQRDPEVTTAAALSRGQFYDHIPSMLDALELRLRAGDLRNEVEARQEEAENAEGHGLQRWQQGYDDREVMREWIALNACLADQMQAFADSRPGLAPAVLSEAWRRVSEFTVTGMSESVAQYARLQRAEAAGRVQALEHALAELGELERQRAEAWRDAAHDLRGNLGMVANVTAVLQQGGASEQFLRLLGRGVASLHALLNDLTTQARLDAGHETRSIAAFDVAASLTQLASSMQLLAADRGLFLAAEGTARLVVDGDEVKVNRIAQNLLHNALKYTSRGGVKLTWEAASDGAPRWNLCVQDTGPGIASDAAAPLASALETATRDGQATERAPAPIGTAAADAAPAPMLPSRSPAERCRNGDGEGVGLSIVKRLCELLDAQLELQTAPGKGTTFRVTFPSRYLKG